MIVSSPAFVTVQDKVTISSGAIVVCDAARPSIMMSGPVAPPWAKSASTTSAKGCGPWGTLAKFTLTIQVPAAAFAM